MGGLYDRLQTVPMEFYGYLAELPRWKAPATPCRGALQLSVGFSCSPGGPAKSKRSSAHLHCHVRTDFRQPCKDSRSSNSSAKLPATLTILWMIFRAVFMANMFKLLPFPDVAHVFGLRFYVLRDVMARRPVTGPRPPHCLQLRSCSLPQVGFGKDPAVGCTKSRQTLDPVEVWSVFSSVDLTLTCRVRK